MPRKNYDIFLSYAHVDDADNHITRLSQEMREIFRRRTGQKLRVFHDRSEIQTAETWQPRIQNALNSSSLLVPVISRAYFSSEWCHQEWYYFAATERSLTSNDQALGLIYPLLVDGLPRVPKGIGADSWVEDVSQRQAVDLAGSAPGSFQHESQVQLLMDGIVAKLHRLNVPGPAVGQPTDREHLNVFCGYVGEGQRFTQLLSEARSATIIGMTNETLAESLGRALENKRRSSGRPEASWESLRIVFLSENLLDSLNDELLDYPDQTEATLQRRRAAENSMRSIRLLLEQAQLDHWELRKSEYQLPFAGTLFEMPDGRRTVQLLMRRSQRRTANQMYLEFDVKPGQYIAGAFEDIVQASNPVKYIIPIGWPRDNGVFRCTGKRFRENVLRDDSRAPGWLPIVLIIAWRTSEAGPELWVQLRTRSNTHREQGRLAHLANYIFQNDVTAADGLPSQDRKEFDLSEAATEVAAKRCFTEDIGEYPWAGVVPVGTSEYVYPDKENLFFYLFTAELPQYPNFLKQSEMRPVSVRSLLYIREVQALRSAARVCKLARRQGATMHREAEIAALNLILHGHPDLAEQVLASSRHPTKLEGASRRIDELSDKALQLRQVDGQVVQVFGLAGLQYREFFTIFLPRYEKLGLPEAAQTLAEVRDDASRQGALDRLSRIYRDEALMSTVSNIEQ